MTTVTNGDYVLRREVIVSCPLRGIPILWLTEIEHWRRPYEFVAVQFIGCVSPVTWRRFLITANSVFKRFFTYARMPSEPRTL